MSQAIVALLGAIVGGLASLTGVVISGVINARADVRRERSARNSVVAERIRTQLTEVLRLMFLVETEIYSVCWLAAKMPQRLDDQRVALYETRMRETLPQLSASMVILAGLDSALYDRVMPWAEKLDILEGRASLSLYVTVQVVAGIQTFPLVSSVRTSKGRRPCLAAVDR